MVRVKVGFNLPLSKFSDPPPQTTPRLESAPHISELAGESHKVAALSQRQTSVCICRKRYNEMWSRLPEARERRGGKCRRTKDSEEGERVTVAAESQRSALSAASAVCGKCSAHIQARSGSGFQSAPLCQKSCSSLLLPPPPLAPAMAV